MGLFACIHPSTITHTRNTHTTNQNTTHREHPETEALLDALTDSLGQAESGPVRALCASVLAEFLDYAIRQVNPKKHTHESKVVRNTYHPSTTITQHTRTQLTRSPVMAEALLTRLERLARHPNRYRRLGGAMALLQATKKMRDEVSACVRACVLCFG